MTNEKTVTVGLVGYGYWGPNLARNFSRQPHCNLAAICDISEARREQAKLHYPHTKITGDYNELLNDPVIDAILVATPVFFHYELAKKALLAGKDILVEKPLTSDVGQAQELVNLAEEKKRVMAVDHTFLYTGAVRKIKELVDSGEIGEIIYMDSVRINLGLFQHDVNVIWDLVPHDFSIFAHISGLTPTSVQAMGHHYGSDKQESVAYVHMEYGNNVIGHCHVNWISPVKLRQTLIGGTKKMIAYDDMEPVEKIRVYDKGIVVEDIDRQDYNKVRIDYRTGDMWAPKIDMQEALDLEAAHFVDCVRNRKTPLADGKLGLDIVRQLVACQESIKQDGKRIQL